jgi:hypothetical protein
MFKIFTFPASHMSATTVPDYPTFAFRTWHHLLLLHQQLKLGISLVVFTLPLSEQFASGLLMRIWASVHTKLELASTARNHFKMFHVDLYYAYALLDWSLVCRLLCLLLTSFLLGCWLLWGITRN